MIDKMVYGMYGVMIIVVNSCQEMPKVGKFDKCCQKLAELAKNGKSWKTLEKAAKKCQELPKVANCF